MMALSVCHPTERHAASVLPLNQANTLTSVLHAGRKILLVCYPSHQIGTLIGKRKQVADVNTGSKWQSRVLNTGPSSFTALTTSQPLLYTLKSLQGWEMDWVHAPNSMPPCPSWKRLENLMKPLIYLISLTMGKLTTFSGKSVLHQCHPLQQVDPY